MYACPHFFCGVFYFQLGSVRYIRTVSARTFAIWTKIKTKPKPNKNWLVLVFLVYVLGVWGIWVSLVLWYGYLGFVLLCLNLYCKFMAFGVLVLSVMGLWFQWFLIYSFARFHIFRTLTVKFWFWVLGACLLLSWNFLVYLFIFLIMGFLFGILYLLTDTESW